MLLSYAAGEAEPGVEPMQPGCRIPAPKCSPQLPPDSPAAWGGRSAPEVGGAEQEQRAELSPAVWWPARGRGRCVCWGRWS